MLTETEVQARLDSLAKPRGSLGRLETLAVQLAMTQGTLHPKSRPARVVLFAADHGVVESGVSAWPSAVTQLMVGTILARRASSSALAAVQGCELRVVDVGVASAISGSTPAFFTDAHVSHGTRNLATEAAMSEEEFERAWSVGANEAQLAVREGAKVLIAGEMGIGNTTAAACLTSLLTGSAVDAAVGRGAGADDPTMERKREVVTQAVARAGAHLPLHPRRAMAALGGFEIVAMAGFFSAGAALGATLVLDGYVATAAALIAWQLDPGVVQRMIASHLSSEPGHAHALAHLKLVPLLDWNMRLGEGTGALVALPLLDSAAALLNDVATLAELGVARED